MKKLKRQIGLFTELGLAVWVFLVLTSSLNGQAAAVEAGAQPPLPVAQQVETAVVPPVPPQPPEPAEGRTIQYRKDGMDWHSGHRDLISFRGLSNVGKNETVDQVVSIFGDAKIEGKVRRDAVVIMGDAKVEGKVGSDLVVILGSAELGPQAEVDRNVWAIGGEIKAAEGAVIRGGKYPFPFPGYEIIGGWVKNGLLYARPLPPSQPWAWYVGGILFLLNVVFGSLFPRQATACVETLDRSPSGALVAGFLGLALFLPFLALLAATVIGILLIPFALAAFVGAGLFGKLVLYRFAGQQLGAQVNVGFIKLPFVALLVGTLMFYLLYTVPLLGLVVWGLASVIGFGSVVLTAGTALRGNPALRKANEGVVQPGYSAPPSTAGISAPDPASSSGVHIDPLAGFAPMTYPFAGFWVRLGALVLDLVLVGVLSAVLQFPPSVLVLLPVYYVGMWTWRGTSIGGIVFGLKLVKTDGGNLNFAVSLIRALSGFFSFLVFGLGFLWIAWDHEKQSWHDKVAGTHVVRIPKGISLV